MGKGIVPFVNDFVKDPKLKTVLLEREGIRNHWLIWAQRRES